MVAQAIAPPKEELKKSDGFIDFSAVSGTFGFKPAAEPKAASLFGAEVETKTDLFGGMEESKGDSMFSGMEEVQQEEPKEEEMDQRQMEAAALFSGLSSTKAVGVKKVVKKKEEKIALQPANPLFAGVSSTGFFKPSEPAQPVQQTIQPAQQTIQPAQPIQPAQQTIQPPVDMFSGMSSASAGDMFGGMESPVVDMMDFNAAASVANEEIDMTQCRLSNTYKIFMKDPASELVLLPHDSTVYLATNMIYRVFTGSLDHP